MEKQPVDKSEIYEQFARLSQQTKDLMESIEILAENARLTIENEHLHEVIADKHVQKTRGRSF